MWVGSLSHTHVARQGHSRVCGAGASSWRGRNRIVPPQPGVGQFFDGPGVSGGLKSSIISHFTTFNVTSTRTTSPVIGSAALVNCVV